MRLTDALALTPDTLIIRVSDLPALARDEIGDEGAFAVTRARGRSPSILIDEASAQLLGEFRQPSTIVEAILRFSRRLALDPEAVLDQAYPTLRRFLLGGYLAAPDSDGMKAHQVAFAVGERVAGGAIVRCVRVLEDTELYQVALDGGGLAALKVLKPQRSGLARGALRREAELLAFIDGRVSPRLIAEGEAKDNLWLCMEWCEGVSIATAAAGLRRMHPADAGLLDLCRGLVETYAALHELGVVHGDVHPANVIASVSGPVRLVDFGLALRVNSDGPSEDPPRGGVQAFFDPQYAAALRTRATPPTASFSSDQFSLGAILYQLITGSPYLDFSIDKDELLRQIVEDRPLPFTRRDHPPWPEMEALLAAALAKDPGRRFAGVADLGRRLAAVAPPDPAAPRRSAAKVDALESVLNEVIAKARPGGDWFDRGLPSRPSCSVAYGAAGLAAALCRVGILRADPELLTLADEWVVRAAREAGNPDAFSSAELKLDESRTGLVSPFHRLSGVHAVQALVSHAMGDAFARQQALDAFVKESRQACEGLDLTLGRSGTLLAAAMLLETIDGSPYADTRGVTDLGSHSLAAIWLDLDSMPPIAEGGPVAHLGVAHGWAGMLLATLRWCRIAPSGMPAALVDRLEQLAALAQSDGLGVRWAWIHDPARRAPATTMPGWCNGSAGFVHLWTTAYAILGDNRWKDLARKAAWDAYSSPMKIAQLCCGLAGQAYALIEMYKHSGEARWLSAASELGARAAARVDGSSGGRLLAASLHKGEVGIAALAADLADPEAAVMPFFGADR